MAPPLLILRDIHLTFGGTPLLAGAELVVSERERLCLVGRNGSGKSTLMKIAAGLVEADKGERFLQPGITLRYLAQEPDLTVVPTTLDFVMQGLAPGDDSHRARYLLEQLGMTGDEPTDRLSGGEARRAALAQALAPSPDILLLDEPTNHLDLPAIEWLEEELKAMRGALVLISHDRRFLESLSRATVWLDRGQSRRLDKGFAAFEGWRDETLEQEERDRHKLDRRIVMEQDWLRYGVTARRKRNQGRLARLQDMRQARREARRVQGNVRLEASESGGSGTMVIEALNIAKAYGERTIVKDFSLRILRGDRIAIVGPNGAGKTTLINLLTGALAPDSGVLKLGTQLDMVVLDQKRAGLDPARPLAETLTDGAGDTVSVNGQPRHVMSYMKDFLFLPEQARTPVGTLSGGERARVLIAKAMAKPSNLLVLDEPTNDLDLETLDLLQEMLTDYPGTALIVSHDRDFIDRTATAVLMAEGDGRFTEYAGGYSDMLAQRGRGVEARVIAAPARSERQREAPSEPRAAPERKRMSFKDKHALETLPARMAALEKDIAARQARLADGSLFTRDPAGANRLTQELATLQGELSAAEERWLELEMLREELGG
jgi:ATP-binding cassette subfamily F protein uup